MAKYLFRVIITKVTSAGSPADYGAGWETSLSDAVANAQGTVESIYFAFGDTDIYMVADLPDEGAVAELSLAIAQGGDATVRTVVLFAPSRVRGPIWTWRPPGT
jgi:GYD domain